MASVPYLCTGLLHHVFQPKIIPETHYPAPRFVEVDVTITVHLLILYRDYLTGHVTRFNNEITEETISFDLHLLDDHVQASEILAAMLTRLKIGPASYTFDDVIDDIIFHVLRFASCLPNMGRMVLPLRAVIWGSVEQHDNNEMVLIRAMEESALATTYGMVPAKESSVKKMLKKVKVKGEDCVICLEEINGGSDASQMPCSHAFHGACIEEWLRQSHSCPLCRFKMPISEN